MNISFLIPCYNDGKTIRWAIEEAVAMGKSEIIVIDDGSTDASAKILKNLKGITLIIHSKNEGYGKTIKELYYAGRSEWLFTVPGDYQVGAKELTKLLPYTQDADMIIGWRKERKDPISRLIQSKIYRYLLWFLFGVKLHDVNSVRLMKKEILKKIHLSSDSAFVDAELAIRSQKAGYKIFEVPIHHRASVKKGRGGGGKWWTIIPTIWEMIKFKINKFDLEDQVAAKTLEKAIIKA